MTPNTSEILESFLPVYDAVPENWDEAKEFLAERLKEIANAVNVREIGFFLDEELLTGKYLFPTSLPQGDSTPQQFRQILRMVVNFGVLPVTGTKSVPHGIYVDSNFTLVQLYAAATDPVALVAIPIPFVQEVDPSNEGIQLYMDSTNVNIVVQSDNSNFTRCIVTIEYTQEP
jgi:hypothetical protein